MLLLAVILLVHSKAIKTSSDQSSSLRILTVLYPNEYRLGSRVLRAQERESPLFICNLLLLLFSLTTLLWP